MKIAQAIQAWGTNVRLTSSPAGTAETTLEQNLHKGDAVPFVLVVPPENPAMTAGTTLPPPDRGCGEAQATPHGYLLAQSPLNAARTFLSLGRAGCLSRRPVRRRVPRAESVF